MKIISFNIRVATRDLNPFGKHFWLKRQIRINRFLKEQDADVVCLQEVTPLQKACLYLVPGYHLTKIDCQNMIMYKGEKRNCCVVKMPVVDQYTQSAMLMLIDNVYICNAHLSWNSTQKQFELIIPHYPDVVCGDMNVTFELKDKLERLHYISNSETTFHKWGKSDAVIDHVYSVFNGNVEVIKNDVMSDHYPLVFYIYNQNTNIRNNSLEAQNDEYEYGHNVSHNKDEVIIF